MKKTFNFNQYFSKAIKIAFILLLPTSFFVFCLQNNLSFFKSLFYFPIQINVIMLIICVIQQLNNSCAKNYRINNFLEICKFASLISMVLILILFSLIEIPYSIIFNNFVIKNWISDIIIKLILPIFAMLDFFINSKVLIKKANVFAISTFFPISYFIFMVICLLAANVNSNENFYFFKIRKPIKNMFLINNGKLGEFYKLLMICLLCIGISFLLLIIKQNLKNRKTYKFVYI